MLPNEEPCESSDQSHSAEDEEDGTDPICSQQRRKRRKRTKNKTKTTAESQGVKLTTGNSKTHETLCIICQKNEKGITPIGTAAGKRQYLKKR